MCKHCNQLGKTCEVSVFTTEKNTNGGRITVSLGMFCDECTSLIIAGKLKLDVPDNALTDIMDLFVE